MKPNLFAAMFLSVSPQSACTWTGRSLNGTNISRAHGLATEQAQRHPACPTVLLSAAVQREDDAVDLAPNRKGSASDRAVGKLLSQGLIEVPVVADCRQFAWHR
jgi:hypothetical protein